MALAIAQEQTAAPAQTPAPETAEQIVEGFSSRLEPVLDWLKEAFGELSVHFFSLDGLLRVGIVAGIGVAAYFLANPARKLIERVWPADKETGFRRGHAVVDRLVFPILWVIGLWIATEVLRQLGMYNLLIRTVASLLNAWIVIRVFSSFVRDPLWSKTFAAIAWVIAALNILRLLNPTIALLDSAAVTMGASRFSLYMAIKGGILVALLLWLASVISAFVHARISKSAAFTPSVQALISQSVRIVLLFAAVMLAMNAIGVDLTALAVFSGALGVGIGFGLQAIFSNLVAGIMLLLERSMKIGDFVELESGVTGAVREINIRSTMITTNDNVDILVPNSEFINKQVINWTLREAFCRTHIPFGVAYGTDKELVRKAVLEAAASVPHMLTGRDARDPQVWLTGFGDSSLDFELVVWLNPAAVKRPSAVKAEYNWAIETALAKYGIEIPFPQRDLHIRSGELPVLITKANAAGVAEKQTGKRRSS